MNKIKNFVQQLKEKDKRAWIELIVFCILVILAVVLVVTLVRQNRGDKAMDEVQKVAKQPEEQQGVLDWEGLWEINKDIYAWIEIPGTNVNYPILQSDEYTDTNYYLEHNIDGSEGLPGCIYTQRLNAKDFEDPVTVIYGHNMRNGTMFRSLHEYKDRAFFDKNRLIYIYTPEKTYTYEIYAAYRSGNELILAEHGLFQSSQEYSRFLEDVQGREETDTLCHINKDMELNNTDKTIILSTCIGNDDYRYLVQAKRIDVKENGTQEQ